MNTDYSQRLNEPFPVNEVKWKAQVVRGQRALTVPYIDARCVEDRLDAVFGVDGWQDCYQVLPNGNVICKLRVKAAQEWIEKSDVGSQSDQPDEGDRMKSAFSDALKRAAVKLGIGRYLYRLPQQWVDFDPNTRQMRQTPQLPEWATPRQSERPATPSRSKATKPAPVRAAEPTCISREQWDTIKRYLVEQDTPVRAFLDFFQIKKGGDLPAELYEHAQELASKPMPKWDAAPVSAA